MLVLSRDTGHQRDYSRDSFARIGDLLNESRQFFFPVSDAGRDPRLKPGEVVISVEVGDTRRGYPIERLGDAVINDTLAETPIVIFSIAKGPTGAAYSAVMDGQTLKFTMVNETIQDEETGSIWSISGVATEGELIGTQLEALPLRSTFWFSLAASYPNIDLYEVK